MSSSRSSLPIYLISYAIRPHYLTQTTKANKIGEKWGETMGVTVSDKSELRWEDVFPWIYNFIMSNPANYSPYNKTYKFILFQNQAYH